MWTKCLCGHWEGKPRETKGALSIPTLDGFIFCILYLINSILLKKKENLSTLLFKKPSYLFLSTNTCALFVRNVVPSILSVLIQDYISSYEY